MGDRGMDIAQRRIKRRLDDQLLEHLQEHCFVQAEVIEYQKAEIARLRNELIDAEVRSEMWHDVVNRLQDSDNPPAHIGITTDGSIVLLPPEPAAQQARVLS